MAQSTNIPCKQQPVTQHQQPLAARIFLVIARRHNLLMVLWWRGQLDNGLRLVRVALAAAANSRLRI
jgi:hypothetical protein